MSMTQIIALREKRAQKWDAAKAFLTAKTGADGTMAAEDAAVLSWHGLAPADRASDTALRRAAAFWPERLAARRLMEARLYALACDSL